MIAKIDKLDLNNCDLMKNCRANRQHNKGGRGEH